MTTQVVPVNEVAYARDLTARIKQATVGLWQLLEEAHAAEVWKKLGHPTWKAYIAAEFGMSEQRSFQLLDQAKVTRLLRAAHHDSTGVESEVVVTEAEARAIKPLVGEVIDDIKQGTPVPEAVAKARAVPVTRVARERVVFADEEPELAEDAHVHQCRFCNAIFDPNVS